MAAKLTSVKMPRPRKRSYHHANLSNALINEVLVALRAGEADALSMRELAQRIGVSHTAAYAHFADKMALWDAVADVGFDRLAAALNEAVAAAASPPARLRAAGLAYLRFARHEPALYRLMFHARPADATPGSGPSGASFDILLAAVAALPVAGSARETPRVRPDALTVWSFVHGLASFEGGGQLGLAASDAIDALERHAVAVLVIGLQHEQPAVADARTPDEP